MAEQCDHYVCRSLVFLLCLGIYYVKFRYHSSSSTLPSDNTQPYATQIDPKSFQCCPSYVFEYINELFEQYPTHSHSLSNRGLITLNVNNCNNPPNHYETWSKIETSSRGQQYSSIERNLLVHFAHKRLTHAVA